MNCAYQYPHPAHPQNVMTMPPTAVQQPQHSTDTEYLEVKFAYNQWTTRIFSRLREIYGQEKFVEGTRAKAEYLFKPL